MPLKEQAENTKFKFIVKNNHSDSDYFNLIKKLISIRNNFSDDTKEFLFWQNEIAGVYKLVADEIISNTNPPVSVVKFGTSGWRGIIGKDLNLNTVFKVTSAIISLYEDAASNPQLALALGVADIVEARRRGCVLGFDNRYGNEILARRVADTLSSNGFTVHYAGEATTGTLSAAVLELKAAFSINLTPSHNPLEYAGFKYNAADGGPAAEILTNKITERSVAMIKEGGSNKFTPNHNLVKDINALTCWISLVKKNKSVHGLDYEKIIGDFAENQDFSLVIDSVHGSSRIHARKLLKSFNEDRLIFLRSEADPTFGGIAPEPSPQNLIPINGVLKNRHEPLKLGVILDPDADRIRFTDGSIDISMNQFGAMAYHFLHEIKKKKGLVAKTVATSNFANAIAEGLNEEVFEPKVGFKEFKPVIDKALVCFEESDGITITGHTPEKDGYIGLLLALDMIMTLKMNLGDYLCKLQKEYGYYYPDKDGVSVSQKGELLLNTLAKLDKFKPGSKLKIGSEELTIEKVINIDGHKMILEDKSWLMIRPSGTEPKVRFYVEARSADQKNELFKTAKNLLKGIGLA